MRPTFGGPGRLQHPPRPLAVDPGAVLLAAGGAVGAVEDDVAPLDGHREVGGAGDVAAQHGHREAGEAGRRRRGCAPGRAPRRHARATRRSASRPPMKPVAPVTSTRRPASAPAISERLTTTRSRARERPTRGAPGLAPRVAGLDQRQRPAPLGARDERLAPQADGAREVVDLAHEDVGEVERRSPLVRRARPASETSRPAIDSRISGSGSQMPTSSLARSPSKTQVLRRLRVRLISTCPVMPGDSGAQWRGSSRSPTRRRPGRRRGTRRPSGPPATRAAGRARGRRSRPARRRPPSPS